MQTELQQLQQQVTQNQAALREALMPGTASDGATGAPPRDGTLTPAASPVAIYNLLGAEDEFAPHAAVPGGQFSTDQP